MAGVSPIYYSPSQQQQQQQPPSISPFISSHTSTSWISTPAFLHISNLFLRSAAFIFSVVSSLSLVARDEQISFKHSDFRYAFCISMLASVYSAVQLLKGISEIAFRGQIISDVVNDYLTFFFDQLVGYLLISSSSVSVSATQRIIEGRLKEVLIASVCMSFAAFIAVAFSAFLSGYKLCKRIIW